MRVNPPERHTHRNPRQAFDSIGPDETKAFDAAVAELKSVGAEIVADVTLLAAEEWARYSSTDQVSLTIVDLANSLSDYFATLETNPKSLHSLQDLIEYTGNTPGEGYPLYNVDTFDLALDKAHYDSDKFRNLTELHEYIKTDGGIEGVLRRENLDVLAVPTAARIPVSFASLAGSPLISMPLGFHGPGTPVGKDKKGDLINLAPGIP